MLEKVVSSPHLVSKEAKLNARVTVELYKALLKRLDRCITGRTRRRLTAPGTSFRASMLLLTTDRQMPVCH